MSTPSEGSTAEFTIDLLKDHVYEMSCSGTGDNGIWYEPTVGAGITEGYLITDDGRASVNLTPTEDTTIRVWRGDIELQIEDLTNKSVQDAPSEYVSVGVGVGSERITNGSFDTDTDWTKGTGWSIGSGVASCDGTQTADSALSQSSVSSAANQDYLVEFDLTVTAGLITSVALGGDTDTTDHSSTGKVSVLLTPTSSNGQLDITGNSAFVGSVDNVTVKACDHGAFIDGVEIQATSAHNNSVTDGVVTEGTPSGDISGDIFYLAEPGVTNECEYGRDVTDTSWTKVNQGPDISYLRNATGIDNIANAASTLSDNSNSFRAEVSATEMIPNDSNPYSVVFFVPKDSNSTTFSAAILSMIGGSTALQQTANWDSSDGTNDELFGYGTDGDYAVDADIGGDWWRVTMTIVNNSTGNTVATLYLIPAANTTLGGILSETPTRDMIFDSVMFLENVDHSTARTISPILTDGSAVSTVADDVYYDITDNFSNTAFTTLFDWKPSVDQIDLDNTDHALVTTSDAAVGLAFYDGTGVQSTDFTNTVIVNPTPNFVSGKVYRVAVKGTNGATFQIGIKNISDSGTWQWSAALAFSGYTLGNYLRTFYGLERPGQMKDLHNYNEEKTNAWIESNY